MNIYLQQKLLDAYLEQDVDLIISTHVNELEGLFSKAGKSFVIFGAGKLGRTVLEGLRKVGLEPKAFADNSPALWGHEVEGVKVFSPDDAKECFKGKVVFINCVYTGTPVRYQLGQLQVDNISFAQLAWKFSDALLPHYALDLPYSIFSQKTDVRRGLTVWEDDTSRNEYLAQLVWRATLDQKVLPPYERENMYFPHDLFKFSPSDILVDCGAFDGDTIKELSQQNIPYGHLHSIEPDPINFRNLQKYVSSLPKDLRNKITIYQNAVGREKKMINFDPTGTARTTIQIGSYEVPSIPLDEIFDSQKPTYIKMDIEGAEYEALLGGRQILERYHPILAICLYHRPEDLWRIPLLIKSMSDEYRLFLRRYSDDCWEQVCYAVPKERI